MHFKQKFVLIFGLPKFYFQAYLKYVDSILVVVCLLLWFWEEFGEKCFHFYKFKWKLKVD